MQTEAVAELQAKFGNKFDIVTQASPPTHGKIYALDGEVTGWRPGIARSEAYGDNTG